MRRFGLLLLVLLPVAQAQGQTPGAPTPNALACGPLKGEATKTGGTSRWTISGPAGNNTETGVLRSGPRFECIDGAITTMEFTSSAGHSIFEAYFPDGTSIAYGHQHIVRRGNRFVLPIQAKARIAAPFRAAFDYHCRLVMPGDPIAPDTRADCVL